MRISRHMLAVLAVVLAAPLASPEARATVTPTTFGALSAGASESFVGFARNSQQSYISFSLTDPLSSFSAIVNEVHLLDLTDLSALQLFLYSGTSPVTPLTPSTQSSGTYAVDPPGPATGIGDLYSSFSFNSLVAGSYVLGIYGIGDGPVLNLGRFRGTASVAGAVPELDTWLMMLIGAGLVAYQLRRKQNSLQQPLASA